MGLPHGNSLTEPSGIFRFSVAVTVTSVLVLTVILAVWTAFALYMNMIPSADSSDTAADHWAAVGLIAYFGLLLFLPISCVFWLIYCPAFKAAARIRVSPLVVGAIVAAVPWAVLGWNIFRDVQLAATIGMTSVGAVIGSLIAKIVMSDATAQNGGVDVI